MKIVEETSAKTAARTRVHRFMSSYAAQWGWDSVVQYIAETMSSTRGREQPERDILRYVNGVGWPELLRECAGVDGVGWCRSRSHDSVR